MNEKEHHPSLLNISDEFDKTNKILSSRNTIFYSFNNLDTSQSNLEQKPLHSVKNNSQINYILSDQHKNIMEKTRSLRNICIHLKSSFLSLCEHVNILGDTDDNVKIKQKDIMDIVDKTTRTLQDQIQNILDVIDDSFKEESIAAKQLQILKKNNYFDLCTFKPNLEECTLKIKNLKIENNISLDKLNEATVELNAEKETVLDLNKHFQKEFKDLEHQDLLLVNQNESMFINYDELLNKTQSLKNECDNMKSSLSLHKNLLNVQSKLIEEQSYNLMKLNETAIKDDFILKKIHGYLKERNNGLMQVFSKIKPSQNEIENKMCTNYDDLFNMPEEKFLNTNKKLPFPKKTKIPNEVFDLKQEFNMSTNTIVGLQEELDTYYILIIKLKNKIGEFTNNLANTLKQVNTSATGSTTEKKSLNKMKIENQNGDYKKERLSENYDDICLNEFMNVSTYSESISKKTIRSLDCSTSKRNSSHLRDIGHSNMKKRKSSFEITTHEVNIKCNQNSKDNDVLNIDSNLTLHTKKIKFENNMKSNNNIQLGTNADSTTANKKMFPIPDDIKHEAVAENCSYQRKEKNN